MKRWNHGVFFAATLVVCLGMANHRVYAQDIPASLTHQGRLLDDEGSPQTGAVELTYTLYDAASGGAVLWQDVLDVTVSDSGFYAVELGGPDNPINAEILADGKVWMGVAVDGSADLEPRIAFNSVPFALRAQQADSANFAALAAGVEAGSIGTEALSEDFALQSEHITEILGDTLGGLSCANGQVTISDGTDWNCGDAVVSLSAGVGITLAGSSSEPQISLDTDMVITDDDARLADARQPTAGSDHYLQNQDSSLQDASFRISGDAEVQGTFRTPNWPIVSGYTQNNIEGLDRIEYEHIEVNSGGHYDSVTSFFTAPVDGIYEMCASIVRESDNAVTLRTEVEGETIMGGPWLWAGGNLSRHSSGCILFPASSGDRIGNYNNINRLIECSQGYCQFSIKLISAQ